MVLTVDIEKGNIKIYFYLFFLWGGGLTEENHICRESTLYLHLLQGLAVTMAAVGPQTGLQFGFYSLFNQV